MKNISGKKLIIILLLMLLLISISTISLAELTQIKPVNPNGAVQIKTIGQQILGVVQTIGVIVAVVVLVVLAVKYMIAAPGDKADVKKSLITYIIGALILFGGVGILNVISALTKDINAKTGGSQGSDVPPMIVVQINEEKVENSIMKG